MCGIAKVQIRLAEMALYGIVGLSADRRNGGGQIGLKRLKHESRPLLVVVSRERQRPGISTICRDL